MAGAYANCSPPCVKSHPPFVLTSTGTSCPLPMTAGDTQPTSVDDIHLTTLSVAPKRQRKPSAVNPDPCMLTNVPPDLSPRLGQIAAVATASYMKSAEPLTASSSPSLPLTVTRRNPSRQAGGEMHRIPPSTHTPATTGSSPNAQPAPSAHTVLKDALTNTDVPPRTGPLLGSTPVILAPATASYVTDPLTNSPPSTSIETVYIPAVRAGLPHTITLEDRCSARVVACTPKTQLNACSALKWPPITLTPCPSPSWPFDGRTARIVAAASYTYSIPSLLDCPPPYTLASTVTAPGAVPGGTMHVASVELSSLHSLTTAPSDPNTHTTRPSTPSNPDPPTLSIVPPSTDPCDGNRLFTLRRSEAAAPTSELRPRANSPCSVDP